MNRREIVKLGLSAFAASTAAPGALWAQDKYPIRPIRLVVPFPGGGVVDTIGRLWGDGVRSDLGPVVVDNKPGAGGTIGAADASRAKPDGYTVLLGNTSTQILNPAIMPSAPYDPEKSFEAVSIVANSAVALAVNPKIPVKSLKELVAYIKENPGKMSYGSPGAGTFTQLGAEMFKHLTGISDADMTHVPYKGVGGAVPDVMSGTISMLAFNVTTQMIGLHKTGKMRILAVMSPKRLDVLPDVPAGAEEIPGLDATMFTGLFVPRGTPKHAIEILSNATRKAMKDEGLQKKLRASGFEIAIDTPAEAQKIVDTEQARLLKLIKEIDFKFG